MDIIDSFLETLRELMSDNNLNQKQLAEMIGVEPTAVGYWFSKTYCPRVINLIRLADLFGCSINYLFGLTDEKEFTSKTLANFWTRLEELKKIKEINDNQLSKLCNIGNSTVSKWRRFKRYPETPIMLKLTEIFGCSIEYLIGRSDA